MPLVPKMVRKYRGRPRALLRDLLADGRQVLRWDNGRDPTLQLFLDAGTINALIAACQAKLLAQKVK